MADDQTIEELTRAVQSLTQQTFDKRLRPVSTLKRWIKLTKHWAMLPGDPKLRADAQKISNQW